jgi:hypothetical protein
MTQQQNRKSTNTHKESEIKESKIEDELKKDDSSVNNEEQ